MILDTNAISDLIAGDVSLAQIVRYAKNVYLSPISIGEYLYGLRGSKRSEVAAASLHAMRDRWPQLEITDRTAEEYALLREELRNAGTPISPNDLWIAAQAREHKMPIITRDADFDKVPGLRRQSW